MKDPDYNYEQHGDNVRQADFGSAEGRGEVVRWADKAMYEAAPLSDRTKTGRTGVINPKVTLLSMSADPLGEIASTCMMYEGKVVYSLSEVTDEQRLHYLEQVTRTHLKAPFEFVQFHFIFEGVTRSFTHQLVRQRTATYAQESLRFAVKESIDEEVALPPSLRSLPDDHPMVVLWKTAVNKSEDVYHALVDGGIPAEDARGLLPHAITTRVHYRTDLRSLLEHAGNRLCTQAQFEWRAVFTEIVKAIREAETKNSGPLDMPGNNGYVKMAANLAALFAPICYMTGKCEFKAQFDRACSIRDRVEDFAAHGVPSSEWGDEKEVTFRDGTEGTLLPIHPAEWLADHTSARVQ